MLKNYLKIAWRNLVRDRTYSFINLLGLSIGLACCLLIIQYVIHEWSYDSFHKQSEQIYRAQYLEKTKSGKQLDARTPVSLAYTLKKEFPEVREAVRLRKLTSWIDMNGNVFKETLLLADSTFLKIFDFRLIKRSSSGLLNSPNDAVITRQFANAHFGNRNPIGKSLDVRIDEEIHSLTVKGIVSEPPSNSSVQFNVIVPYKKLEKISPAFGDMNNWFLRSPRTYVLLHPETNIPELEHKVNTYLKGNIEEQAFDDTELTLMNISDIHLTPEVSGGLEPVSKPVYSIILAGIALFILFLACINYVTLSLGRTGKRIREVGIRKSFGGTQKDLLVQFNGESILIVMISLLFGLLMAELLMPYFNQLVGKELDFMLLSSPSIILLLVGLALTTGLLSGVYPSLIISRFNPAEIIMSRFDIRGNPLLTKVMVGLQFCLSAVLIVTVLTMQNQLRLMTNKDLGYNKEQVVMLEVPTDQGRDILADLRNLLSDQSSIVSISGIWQEFPAVPGVNDQSMVFDGNRELQAYVINTEPKIVETLRLEIVNDEGIPGRIEDMGPGNILVNQQMVSSMGWENPIGKTLTVSNTYDTKVAGVVEDFHFQSLHEEIKPAIINAFPPMRAMDTIFIRIVPGDPASTLNLIEKSWKQVASHYPFVYHFMDDKVDRLYQNEQRWSMVSAYATFFGIFIACIGLFGLAVQSTGRRKKEISIRKVLGADISDILGMLSLDFLKPVMLGLAIAVPIGWIVMNRWLASFAYRTEIGTGIFTLAACLALILALATVSWQSIRAALANPVDSLRNE